jgi:hypothetical protein
MLRTYSSPRGRTRQEFAIRTAIGATREHGPADLEEI